MKFLILVYAISGRIAFCFMNSTTSSRRLQLNRYCDTTASSKAEYQPYFDAMKNIYSISDLGTCVPVHKECGWIRSDSKLPLFVLSVGLEGAGHHLWTELFDKPVFDCVWKNARHYMRDVADGVPRTTTSHLEEGLREQLAYRKDKGLPPCKSIYDSEDSFPTGAIRKSGRVFMRPDIINLQQLDGVLFNIKYIIILRNVTDTAMSALRRNFFSTVAEELRTVEHTLTYLEAALRGVPCHKTFLAHYEHVLTDPSVYVAPLADFLELSSKQYQVLAGRMTKPAKRRTPPARKRHSLGQFEECKSSHLEGDECYNKVAALLESFFADRAYMWPTFAGNGFDFSPPLR